MMFKNIKNKIGKLSEIPEKSVFNQNYVSIESNSGILLENHRGIIEFSAEKIIIDTKNYLIFVYGTNLKIDYITDDAIHIIGTIFCVKYDDGSEEIN